MNGRMWRWPPWRARHDLASLNFPVYALLGVMPEQTRKMRQWAGLFRLLGAIALSAAFFLPVSSCSSPFAGNYEGAQMADSNAAAKDVTAAQRHYRYPYKMLAIDNPSSLPIVVAFFWPLFVLGVRKFRPRRVGGKFTIMEALLCLVTVWAVWSMGYLARPEIGSYVAYAGAALYLAAASADLAQAAKRKRRLKLFQSRHSGIFR